MTATPDGPIPPAVVRILLSTPGLLALAAFVAAVSLNSQSFWIDEYGTWFLARASNPREWLTVFVGTTDSDGQIVLYHFLVFLWSRIAGLSEWSLRGINVVFLAVALVVLGRARWLSSQERAVLVVLLGLNGFVIAYMNEARQYMLLLCGASLLLAGSLENAAYVQSNARDRLDNALRLMLAGGIVSVGATAVSGIFALLIVIANATFWRAQQWRDVIAWLRRRILFVVIMGLLATAIASLIFYSVMKGSKPNTVNSTSIATIGFGVMEVLGAAGYLPGRAELRQGSAGAIRPWQWAAVLCVMVCTTTLILQGVRRARSPVLVAVALATAASAAFVAASGYFIGYRVLGRHFSFVVPVACAFMAIGLISLPQATRRIAFLVLCVLLIGSSASIRLAERHAKEDFNGALAMTAREIARGASVWWIGDARALAFRGIPYVLLDEALGTPPTRGVILLPEGMAAAPIERLPIPALLVLQRPEQNDPDRRLRDALSSRGLTLERDLNGLVIQTARE